MLLLPLKSVHGFELFRNMELEIRVIKEKSRLP
jgi:hypothetical protein